MTRREFAALGVAAALQAQAPASKMGIASTSTMSRGSSPNSGLAFLERCHAIGAGGVQTAVGAEPAKLRARAEQLGMYVEAFLSLPRNGDAAAFERSVAAAKEAGALCGRVACLSGRRYESFDTLDAWKHFVKTSHEALALAVPILEKHRLAAAIENHKDWTLDEHLDIIRKYSTEYLGVLFDFGNSISLLDDPNEQVERLAPYIISTHVKDMGLESYEDGFLLSEVPLGEGVLDLAKLCRAIQAARPRTKFTLEMITRDPLKIPTLTDKYWATFPDRGGRYLARTLKMVRDKGTKGLPVVSKLSEAERGELFDRNNAACLKYSREKLAI